MALVIPVPLPIPPNLQNCLEGKINKKALQSKFTLLSFNNTKIQSVNGSKEHYSTLKSNFINIHVQKLTYPSLIYEHWTFTEHCDHQNKANICGAVYLLHTKAFERRLKVFRFTCDNYYHIMRDVFFQKAGKELRICFQKQSVGQFTTYWTNT